MQGLWKNSISGYNRKGNKRKKQNLNHFYNDKIDGILNNSTYLSSELNKSKESIIYRNKTIKEEGKENCHDQILLLLPIYLLLSKEVSYKEEK